MLTYIHTDILYIHTYIHMILNDTGKLLFNIASKTEFNYIMEGDYAFIDHTTKESVGLPYIHYHRAEVTISHTYMRALELFPFC
jgi:hypothetical protein